MANDLVVRLLLKSGAFSNDIKTAKGQVQNFRNGCKQAGDGVKAFTGSLGLNITSLTKFSGVMAVATAAGKTIKDGLKQNADFMDEFARKTNTAKGVWNNFTNAMMNGGAISSFKELRKEIREAYDAWDDWNVANGAVQTVLSVQETQYRRLIEVAKDVSLADVDRLDALNQATVLMQKQIDMQRSLANLDKRRSKEALDEALVSKGLNISNVSQKTLKDFLNVDTNGTWGFDKYLNENKPSSKKLEKIWKGGGGAYALASALHDISRDNDKGFKILQDYVKNNLFNYGSELVDYNEQQMKTEIERLRKRILRQDDASVKAKNKAAEDARKEQEEQARLAADAVGYLEDQIKKENEKLSSIKEGTNAWLEQYDAIQKLNKELDETKNKLDIINSRKAEPLAKIDSSKLYSGARAVVQNPTGLAMKNTSPVKQASLGIDMSGIQTAQAFTSSLQNSANAVTMLSESLRNLREMEDENISGFGMFVNSLSMGVNMLNTLSSVMQTVNTITELFGATSKAAAADKLASDATIIASTQATAGTQVAANTAVAGSGAAAAMASIPWVGPALAAAAVAGIIALLATSLPKFATGGIVGGNSFTGDRVLAGVNSGEMILNKSQQSNLWRQINSNVGGNNQVEFHISGTELVGVLNNNNRKSRLVR